MRWLKDKRAVSPVVGVILMVAITIVLAATIYIWISSMSSPATAAPSINLRGEFEKNGNNYNLVLTVVSVQGDARWEDLDIKVPNGLTPKIYKDGTETNTGMVEAGDYIKIDVSSFSDSEITVQIVHVPSNSVIYENTFLVPQTSESGGS